MKWEHRHTFLFILVLAAVSGAIVYKMPVRLGLDLKGGSHLVYQAKPTPEILKQLKDQEQPISTLIDRAKEIIRKRVDTLGVAEPSIQVQGNDRIIVELPGIKDTKRATDIIGKTAILEFKDEKGKIIVTGANLKNAQVGFDQLNQPEVDFEWDKVGAKKFANFTSQNVGKNLGIFLDKKVISNPRINEPILGGSGRITGKFSVQEAQDLANLLSGGALPVPLERVEERSVGPTLGRDSIQKSIAAGMVGIGFVLLFMLLYYRLPGFIADIALCFYTLFVLALFKLIGVTLTLPGIAGFILSIGMAVDANVLIFERLREELRAGKTLKAAIDAGFSRAFTSIFDSNVASLITCAALYTFGTGPVAGFAVTLAIGVVMSMFTAITCTRTLLHLVVSGGTFEKPVFFGVSQENPFMIRKNFNIIGARNVWFALSGLVVIPGLVYLFPLSSLSHFPPETGLKKGIDFTGGSLIQVGFVKEEKNREKTVLENQIKALSDPKKKLTQDEKKKLKEAKEKKASLPDVLVTALPAPSAEKIRTTLSALELGDSPIQPLGKNAVLIRTRHLAPEQKNKLEELFKKENGKIEKFESVGPLIGKELTRKALMAVLASSAGIVIYLAFRFNQMKFGICAILALLHDVLVLTGIFAILGKFLGVEVDSMFVTATLTVIGFSVHDTIVIFDRIRENLKLKKQTQMFEETVNFSVLQTFTRSLNTSLTVVFTLIAMLLYGGPVVKYLNLALLIGIVSGTYSSIFNASPLLVVWENMVSKTKKPDTTPSKQHVSKSFFPASPQPSTFTVPSAPESEDKKLEKKKIKSGKQRRR